MNGILGAVMAIAGVICAWWGARTARRGADGVFGPACIEGWSRAARAGSGPRGLGLGLWLGALAPPSVEQARLAGSLARGRHADWGPALAAGLGCSISGLVAFAVATAAGLGRERPDVALGLALALGAASALSHPSPRRSAETAASARWLSGWCAFALGSLVFSAGATRGLYLTPAALRVVSPSPALWIGSVAAGLFLARLRGGWGLGSLLAGVGAASGLLSPALSAAILCGGPLGAALPPLRSLVRGEVRPLLISLPAALVTVTTLVALAIGGLPERVLAGASAALLPGLPLVAGWTVAAALVLALGPPLALALEDLLHEEADGREPAPWPAALGHVEAERRVRELEALVRAVARHVLAEVPASEYRLEHLRAEAMLHARAVDDLFEATPATPGEAGHPLHDVLAHSRALTAQLERLYALEAMALPPQRLPNDALRNRWRQLRLSVQAQVAGGEEAARRAIESHAAHLARVLGTPLHAGRPVPQGAPDPRAPLPGARTAAAAPAAHAVLGATGFAPDRSSDHPSGVPHAPTPTGRPATGGLGDTQVLHGAALAGLPPASRVAFGHALSLLLELGRGMAHLRASESDPGERDEDDLGEA